MVGTFPLACATTPVPARPAIVLPLSTGGRIEVRGYFQHPPEPRSADRLTP